MRNLLAVVLGVGLLAVAACGSSNTTAGSCGDEGGECLNTGAACGDSLPFSCPSGGVCCSPTYKTTGAAKTPSPEPTAH